MGGNNRERRVGSKEGDKDLLQEFKGEGRRP